MLMLVPTSHVALDLQANVTFQAPASRTHGTATITLGRGGPGWDTALTISEGGTYVELITAGGTFKGVTDAPEFAPDSCKITVLALSTWLDGRLVAHRPTYQAMTAGTLARRAALDALGGLGAASIVPGVFCEGGQPLSSYQFSGQSLLSVLNDLTQRSGQEWEIDDAGRLNWQPRSGRYLELTLVDDGRLFGSDQAVSLTDRSREVIEQDANGVVFDVVSGDVPVLWPRQTTAGS